jgi:hypothetical protein
MTDAQLDNVFFQAGHALGGYVVPTTLALFHVHHWLIISIVGVMLSAAVKEFYIDQNYEDAATRGSNLEDFSFYIVGLAIGIFVCWKAGNAL